MSTLSNVEKFNMNVIIYTEKVHVCELQEYE